jgi:hypothetical protein
MGAVALLAATVGVMRGTYRPCRSVSWTAFASAVSPMTKSARTASPDVKELGRSTRARYRR